MCPVPSRRRCAAGPPGRPTARTCRHPVRRAWSRNGRTIAPGQAPSSSGKRAEEPAPGGESLLQHRLEFPRVDPEVVMAGIAAFTGDRSIELPKGMAAQGCEVPGKQVAE